MAPTLVVDDVVETSTLPWWYVTAGNRMKRYGEESGYDETVVAAHVTLMDEVRTALLDYPDPDAITDLTFGCVWIHCRSYMSQLKLKDYLRGRGFRCLGRGYYSNCIEVTCRETG